LEACPEHAREAADHREDTDGRAAGFSRAERGRHRRDVEPALAGSATARGDSIAGKYDSPMGVSEFSGERAR
jgi:hypothetical protein